jgi:hypothetical protein
MTYCFYVAVGVLLFLQDVPIIDFRFHVAMVTGTPPQLFTQSGRFNIILTSHGKQYRLSTGNAEPAQRGASFVYADKIR